MCYPDIGLLLSSLQALVLFGGTLVQVVDSTVPGNFFEWSLPPDSGPSAASLTTRQTREGEANVYQSIFQVYQAVIGPSVFNVVVSIAVVSNFTSLCHSGPSSPFTTEVASGSSPSGISFVVVTDINSSSAGGALVLSVIIGFWGRK